MRRQTHPVERRAVQIDDVDLVNRTAHVKDQTQGRFLVSFRYTDGAFQIPAPGEVWIVERNTSHEWHLFRRRDKNAEHLDMQDMSPGDTRLRAPGTIHARAQGFALNSRLIGATVWEKVTTSGATTTWLLTNTPILTSVQLFNNGSLTDPSGITLAGKTLTFPSIATGHTLIVYYQTAGN